MQRRLIQSAFMPYFRRFVHKCRSFFLRQVGDQLLRKVTYHQKWSVVLVDEIAVVGASLERIDRIVSMYNSRCLSEHLAPVRWASA